MYSHNFTHDGITDYFKVFLQCLLNAPPQKKCQVAYSYKVKSVPEGPSYRWLNIMPFCFQICGALEEIKP